MKSEQIREIARSVIEENEQMEKKIQAGMDMIIELANSIKKESKEQRFIGLFKRGTVDVVRICVPELVDPAWGGRYVEFNIMEGQWKGRDEKTYSTEVNGYNYLTTKELVTRLVLSGRWERFIDFYTNTVIPRFLQNLEIPTFSV